MKDIILPKNAITLFKGANKAFDLAVSKNDGKDVQDLTGATIYLTVRKEREDEVPLIFKTSNDTSQINITEPKAGKARIFFVPADTSKLQVRQYVFDVWVRLVSGEQFPVIAPTVLDLQRGVTVL